MLFSGPQTGKSAISGHATGSPLPHQQRAACRARGDQLFRSTMNGLKKAAWAETAKMLSVAIHDPSFSALIET